MDGEEEKKKKVRHLPAIRDTPSSALPVGSAVLLVNSALDMIPNYKKN